MSTSPQHPFVVELADGAIVGGAQTEADAVVLAGAAFARTGLQANVRDGAGGTVTAQIGLENADQPTLAVGPQIASLNPATTPVGLPPQILTVTGTGFDEGSEILWNSGVVPTTYESATELRARLDVEAGSGVSGDQISVQVRDSQGYASNIVYFAWE
jgi:IPT/TIG domain-containing protein